MKEDNKLVKVYSGNETNAILLKGRLEDIGVTATIQNDSADRFMLGIPVAVDLYILNSDYSKAEQTIKEFVKKNK